MTMPGDRRSPEERRLLEALIQEQTTSLDAARDAFEEVVPELRKQSRRSLVIAICAGIAVVLFAASTALALWALSDSQGAQSAADRASATALANHTAAKAARQANLASCRAGNDFRTGNHEMWDFAINAFRASAKDPNEIKVLNADQALNDKTNALRDCAALYPPPKMPHG